MRPVSYKNAILEECHKNRILKFTNCLLFRDGSNMDPKWSKGDLWVRNGKVIDPYQLFYGEHLLEDICIDCEGLLLVPGFLDIQVNGAFGVDFSMACCSRIEGNEFANIFNDVANKFFKFGVTGICPTIITSSEETYSNMAKLMSSFASDRIDNELLNPSFLGFHLEGPAISIKKSGCHPTEYLASCKWLLNSICANFPYIAYVTLAPELESSSDAIKYFVENGVSVSLGHTDASMVDGERAMNDGANCITHLFNAMRPVNSLISITEILGYLDY